ncbi:uncharacterized protein EMH_0090890 [Eimeria mitis]|uniref:Uncharacterized protein n=1 Tax=Eimeria mitis TaxID=44415 RepID=U6KF45_9EIME|nr:uncharacterized protein EMH_0090890 [Eimeria mitis]CDJ36574.1 hypothetical protein EMH_0090890 [Eimeria mitis]
MCLVGVDFFSGGISCQSHVVCGLMVVVITVSDHAWGTFPPRLLVLKLFGTSVAALIGNQGYRIVQSAAHRRQGGGSTRSQGAFIKDATNHLKRNYQMQPPVSADSLSLELPSLVRQRRIRSRGCRPDGCSGATLVTRGMRRYLTDFESYLPLYLQAVHHRLTICRGGASECVTEIGGAIPREKQVLA